MRLHFLGIGAAYNPVWGSNSAFFTAEDQLYLLDCGETTFQHIVMRPELAACAEANILITHLHTDHIGSLGSFISYCSCVLKKRVLIASPDAMLPRLLSLMGISDDYYIFQQDFSKPMPGGIIVTPVRVVHAPDMACYGYYLTDSRETIYYSGDSSTLLQTTLEKLAGGDLARIYQETTFECGSHPAHCTLEQLCNIVPMPLREKIICMHLDSDFRIAIRHAGFDVAAIIEE